MVLIPNTDRRPGECRDPYAVSFRLGARGVAFRSNEDRWLWVPAFAGTTWGEILRPSPSPSLPRRDDLDLVAVLKRRLAPAAFRQHVVIQCDREMVTLIFELTEQRVNAG